MNVQGVVIVVAALLGSTGISGYLATRPSRSTREGALIDQYQERYAEQVSEMKDMKAGQAELEKRIRTLERRDISYRNYMYTLIKHIEEGVGPPPPPMPSDLYS